MAINYYPRAGDLFICDFAKFKAPEMWETRPVVVISPKLPFRSEIVTIVPISTTPPKHDLPFVYKLSKNYNPTAPKNLDVWAKADMVLNLGLWRLSGFKVGRRKYHFPKLEPHDLDGVRKAVIYGLGMHHLYEEIDSLTKALNDEAPSKDEAPDNNS